MVEAAEPPLLQPREQLALYKVAVSLREAEEDVKVLLFVGAATRDRAQEVQEAEKAGIAVELRLKPRL